MSVFKFSSRDQVIVPAQNQDSTLNLFQSPSTASNEQITWRQITLALIYAIVFWWFSTAVIIYFNFQPEFKGELFWTAFALALGAGYLLYRHRNDETIRGSYITFTAASLIWAFVEVSFYTGMIVGPAVRPIFTVGPSLQGFFSAIHRSAYHESLVLTMAIIAVLSIFRSKNKFGYYTFLIFWLMHQSAKLNIFLGVMNTGKEFVPEAVSDMASYMTIAHMNWLFPISVTVCTLIAYNSLSKTKSEPLAWKKIGFALTGMMILLALIEHWLLVLPLNESLWHISLQRMH